MTERPRLSVQFRNRRVGTLTPIDGGRIAFSYAQEWTNSSNAFPVSLSLPLKGGWVPGTSDHRWFANLLPEAETREALARELRVAQDNDYLLLEKVGQEVAGALSIVPEDDQGHPPPEPSIRWFSDDEIQAKVGATNPGERIMVEGRIRLSLAGAQTKWAVRVGPDGQIGLPQGTLPSTHILKFSGQRVAHLAHNEAFTTFLAAKLELDAVEVRACEGFSLVTRYDRVTDGGGSTIRLHQEDFCQALGLPSAAKYEGAVREVDLGRCVDLLRRESSLPAQDITRLVRWQLCNLLLGNSDGHAKNLSILYGSEGIRLSPFYDLVCTRAYPSVDRSLGLSIGGQSDPGQVRRIDLEALAHRCQIRPTLVLRELDRLVTNLKKNLGGWMEEYARDRGSSPALEMVAKVVKAQVRRTQTACLED